MNDDVFSAFEVVAGLDAKRRSLPPSRRRSAAPVSELSVRDAVMREIAIRGGHGIVKHMTGAGTRGTPDVLACVAGRMLVVECKRVGHVPTAAQLGQLRKWQDAGALACWVQNVGHLRQVLEHLGNPSWYNDFDHPGDGRDADAPW